MKYGKRKRKRNLKNQKGMAVLEALPIIWVMFILLGATLGSWGIVHTSILHSIAARNYNFFLFNNRSDLAYLRDFSKQDGYVGLKAEVHGRYYRIDNSTGHGKRFSYIVAKLPTLTTETQATLRRVDFRNITYDDRDKFLEGGYAHTNIDTANKVPDRNKKTKVEPAWIMVGYGICLSANCGD